MTWKAVVSAFVILIMIALPLTGGVCAVVCDAQAGIAIDHSHHHAAAVASESGSTASASIPRVRDAGNQDCGDDAMLQPLAATELRGLSSNALVADLSLTTPVVAVLARPSFDDGRAPARALPLPHSSLVLRI